MLYGCFLEREEGHSHRLLRQKSAGHRLAVCRVVHCASPYCPRLATQSAGFSSSFCGLFTHVCGNGLIYLKFIYTRATLFCSIPFNGICIVFGMMEANGSCRSSAYAKCTQNRFFPNQFILAASLSRSLSAFARICSIKNSKMITSNDLF